MFKIKKKQEKCLNLKRKEQECLKLKRKKKQKKKGNIDRELRKMFKPDEQFLIFIFKKLVSIIPAYLVTFCLKVKSMGML